MQFGITIGRNKFLPPHFLLFFFGKSDLDHSFLVSQYFSFTDPPWKSHSFCRYSGITRFMVGNFSVFWCGGVGSFPSTHTFAGGSDASSSCELVNGSERCELVHIVKE